jgi:hypothetical protein
VHVGEVLFIGMYYLQNWLKNLLVDFNLVHRIYRLVALLSVCLRTLSQLVYVHKVMECLCDFSCSLCQGNRCLVIFYYL